MSLVYSVARRKVGGDAHLAQAVTRRVFVDLARKAEGLADREVLMSASMRMPNVTGHPDPEGGLRRYREGVLATAARNLETLLGAGDLRNAQVFGQQVLLFDDTAQTKALLERHATRAGKPGFVAGLAK